MKILIKNVDIITSQENNMFISNGFIGVVDGNIAKLTQKEEDILDFSPDKVIDGKKMIAMPGLVNAHTHSPMTILRNYADDLPLEDWLFHHIFPVEAKLTDEDIYWGSVLGIAEMIKSGTTSFADMYYFVDKTAKAVIESGMRANLSLSAYPFTFKDEGPIFFDKSNEFETFYKKWENIGNGLLKINVLVHSPYIYNIEEMRNSANVAKQLGTGIHIHILETEKELKDTVAKYGKDGAQACLDAGIFDVPCIAAHCVYVSDQNMKVFQEKGVSVVHNPTSNLKLGSGIARVPQMQKMGVNVAIGTDGTASNNNLNMFEEIHLSALIHKGNEKNPTLVSAQDAILMATKNGAQAIGFGDQIGVIKEGMRGDIILIDRDKVHLTPYQNPVSAIAYSVQGSDVDTVIIDGKIVMEKGELKTIDVEKATFEVEKIAKRILG
jgi:5-methylthioadenosine/S-adenosylhomocysteine deaminase